MKAAFIRPMLLLKTEKLPEGPNWMYELKVDGFRSVAFKSGGRVQLRSRNDKDFSRAYPSIVHGLAGLPDDTVIDGEVVALDESGRRSASAINCWCPGDNSMTCYSLRVHTCKSVLALDRVNHEDSLPE